MKKRSIWSSIIGGCIVFSMMIGMMNFAQAAYTDSKFDGSIILGRPNNSSITANITATTQSQVYLEWGESSNTYIHKSSVGEASNLKPAVIVMDGLAADKAYYYRLFFKDATTNEFKNTSEYTYRTPRAEGEAYTFVVQSDSHLFNKADKEIYAKSMQTMAGYKPDFMFDLGDTFLNDQFADGKNNNNPQYQSYETIRSTTFDQRAYFDTVTRNAPLFLTIGNHEGEYGNFFDGTDKNLAVMSTLARTTYYPNPIPDEFYSGNIESESFVGQPQNYYAFEWGDALYVSIDPYRYTTMNPYATGKDGWGWTLGKEQYDWFRKTLEESTAKYKFVFAHHASGLARGGAEMASLYEWGGYAKNGQYLFDEKRPGWGKPIQQVMKDTGVTIFFQGHDHLFARENVDGVVYQSIPKPAERTPDQLSNYDAFPDADMLMNTGFLKIDVTPENVQVDYFRNYYVSTDSQEGNTGIVYSYTVDADHTVNVLKSVCDDLSTYGSRKKTTAVNKTPVVNTAPIDKKTTPIVEKTTPIVEKTNQIAIEVDGKSIATDVQPFLDENGRTQVPIRFIAEQLGCQVLWEENGKKDTVTIKKDATMIELKINDKTAKVNGLEKQLDTAASMKDSRTFVPVRFISELLGAIVDWDATKNAVIISTGAKIQ